MGNVITKILASIMALVGLVTVVWIGPSQIRTASASQSWPKVEGTFDRVEVRESTRSRGGRSYSVEVEYRYFVDGQTYTNDRYSASHVTKPVRTKQQGMTWIGKHPAGSWTEVYYDPEDPKSSVLVPGGSGGWATLGFGVVLLGVGAWLFVRGGQAGSRTARQRR